MVHYWHQEAIRGIWESLTDIGHYRRAPNSLWLGAHEGAAANGGKQSEKQGAGSMVKTNKSSVGRLQPVRVAQHPQW